MFIRHSLKSILDYTARLCQSLTSNIDRETFNSSRRSHGEVPRGSRSDDALRNRVRIWCHCWPLNMPKLALAQSCPYHWSWTSRVRAVSLLTCASWRHSSYIDQAKSHVPLPLPNGLKALNIGELSTTSLSGLSLRSIDAYPGTWTPIPLTL